MRNPENDNRQTVRPVTQPNAFKDALHYEGVSELVHMNKWHFLLVIERLQRRTKGPRLEHVVIPLSIFLTLLLAILTADFKDSLGFKADVWQATALMFTILSAIATLVLFPMWIANKIRNKEQHPEDILSEVIREMENEQTKLESASQQAKQHDTR